MNTNDETIVMDNVVCYSTMSGELPVFVREGIPKTFVEWRDYVMLQRKYEALVAEREQGKMIITDEDKKAIYLAYSKWANQLFDDLEDKSSITAEELVYKVLSLVESSLTEQELAEEYVKK